MSQNGSTSLAPRELFGGAIVMNLPVQYGDASDLRQIPDNQEVFLSPDSDTSLVVEVLGLVEEGSAGEDLWEAAKYHFASLAHDNAALSSQIITEPPADRTPSLPTQVPSALSALSSPIPTPEPTLLQGVQKIHKYSYDPSGAPRAGHEGDVPDEVLVCVALWRVWLEIHDHDGESNGAGDGGGREGGGGGGRTRTKKADVVCSVNINLSSLDADGQAERRRVEEWWGDVVRGMRIVDYGLFGDSEE